jgi:DNA/RNA-binding domain of Phe-tRNA-synthetase-like protein
VERYDLHMPFALSLAPELSGRVRLGVLVLEGVTVKAEDAALAAEIEAYGRELRTRYAATPSAEVPGAADARALYKSLGIDPTKTRPSNEALLRRVLKGEALYRVNTLVDALNLCSLRFQLPFGLYDLAHVEPPVVLRRGAANEAYEGIRKGPVNVEGRPVLADARGAFGNPTSDSARTMITLEARNALVTIYAPAAFATTRLNEVLDGSEATLIAACGGKRTERLLLP